MCGLLVDLLIAVKERLPDKLKENTGYLLIAPAIASVGVMVAGLIQLTYISFLTFDPIKLFLPEPSIKSYLTIFSRPVYGTVMVRTLGISLLVSLSCLALGIPYAYYLVRTESPLLQKILIVLALAPFFIGEIVKAYGWLIILGRNGLISYVSKSLFGVELNLIYTPFSVYLGLLQTMLPFAVFVLAPAVAAVPRETEMAAQNLGATPLQSFIHVILPQLKPGILSAFLVTFTISATEYAIPDLLGGGLVDFVANQIYTVLFNSLNYPLAAALSIVLVLVVSLVVYLVLKIGRVGNIFIRGG